MEIIVKKPTPEELEALDVKQWGSGSAQRVLLTGHILIKRHAIYMKGR